MSRDLNYDLALDLEESGFQGFGGSSTSRENPLLNIESPRDTLARQQQEINIGHGDFIDKMVGGEKSLFGRAFHRPELSTGWDADPAFRRPLAAGDETFTKFVNAYSKRFYNQNKDSLSEKGIESYDDFLNRLDVAKAGHKGALELAMQESKEFPGQYVDWSLKSPGMKKSYIPGPQGSLGKFSPDSLTYKYLSGLEAHLEGNKTFKQRSAIDRMFGANK